MNLVVTVFKDLLDLKTPLEVCFFVFVMTFSITTKDTRGLYIFVLEGLAWIFISLFLFL